MRFYITATDITSTRLTVTGCYRQQDQAESAIENDEQSGCFDADERIAIGTRAYHNGCGFCWLTGGSD